MATDLKKHAVCLYCNKNPVPLAKWNRRCDECRAKVEEKTSTIEVNIGHPQPAAVLEDDNGNKIFVDKFGNKLDNTGYDLENDPRGYKFTGLQPEKLDIL